MLTENEKLESYGKLYISMLRKELLDKPDPYDKTICINLLSDGNRYPDLFSDLKSNLLNNDDVVPEVKNKVANMHIDTVDTAYINMESLISSLEDSIKIYTSTGNKAISFFIFGTSHIDNATFEFHKLIKKHNEFLIKIVHS